MSVSDTEEKIVSAICDHFLNGVKEKMTLQLIAAKVGISRQAFHKNYLHLKPYITGHRKIDELLLRQGVDSSKIIIRTQQLVRELESELKELKATEEARYHEFESDFITSLMTSDILTHRAKELTAALKKKALQVELLKRELEEKDAELSLVAVEEKSVPPPVRNRNIDIHIFKPDLAAAFSFHEQNDDIAAYLSLKRKAIDAMQQQVLRILKQGTIKVIVFQERFLCSFDKFVDHHFSKSSASLIVINLPVYSRSEMKEFMRALKGAIPLELFIPFSDSDAVINAQRGFLFRNVPAFEFKSMAKEPLPTIQDGYDKVSVFRIAQGD